MSSRMKVNIFLQSLCKKICYIIAHVMSRLFDFSRPLPSKKFPANLKLTDSVNRKYYICGMPTSSISSSLLA